MKIWKAAAYSLTGVMGAAIGGFGAGWCSWLAAAMILLVCGCGILICLHEMAAIRAHERRKAEAARRSAWRAAFMREVSRF